MLLTEITKLLNQHDINTNIIYQENSDIVQVAGLKEALGNEVSFFNDIKRLEELKTTSAGLVLLKEEYAHYLVGEHAINHIIVDDPYYAYAVIAQHLNPINFHPAISKKSSICSSSLVPESCHIGDFSVIEENVTLGENCIIEAGSFIGKGVVLGNGVHIHPNVTIMENCIVGENTNIESGSVIGGQGFGFANNKGQWVRIPQVGRVIIGANVWVGNNCTIDRGAINDTCIADNCIIDNLVHIAHNVEIGEGTAIAGQVGFAGSTKVGKHNIFAGQVGVTGHITIADKSHFGAKAGITNSIKEGGSYSGFPAVETAKWQKMIVRTKTLDKTNKKLKDLEKQILELQNKLDKKI